MELFKTLTLEEEVTFRQWARDNYDPTITQIGTVWHPIIVDECAKMYAEHYGFNYDVNKNKNLYVLVTWPESQSFMEESWFESEAILADDKVGSSAYFIPLHLLK